jgi:hypothetical protein
MGLKNIHEHLESAFENGLSYAEYSALNKQYAKEGRTTGPQKEAYIEYTKLSAARMRRWEKVYKPHPDFCDFLDGLSLVGDKWLVFSETWCGDAAHNLPFITHWAERVGAQMRIIMRDENLPLMDEFLTGGGRSIPKLVRMDAQYNVLGSWGPRPTPLMKHYAVWKLEPEFDYKEWVLFAQEWYNSDKGQSLEEDFKALLTK